MREAVWGIRNETERTKSVGSCFSGFSGKRVRTGEYTSGIRGKDPGFFADQLTNRELEDFLAHYDECRECRDELSIQYLIHTGLARLETGEVFNLQKELAAYVALERGRLFRRERNVKLTALYELFTLLAFAGAVAACYVLGIV